MSSCQIVSFDPSGKLSLTDQGQKFLSSLQGKHTIISIAGPYRSGKSFIFNLLTNSETFKVGSTVQACTQGLWLHQITQNRQSFLFIDIEGFGSTTRSSSDDGKLFAIALTISSLVIYNSIGVINESKINHLALALSYCQIISSQSSNLSNPPQLIWLLRDFILELVNTSGDKISADQYLESTLVKLDTKDAKSVNMRKTIIQTFPNRTCIPLPRPAEDENVLQNLNETQLSPEFLKGLKKLKKIVFAAQAKQMNKKFVRGQDLVALIKDLVNGLNSDQIPSVPSAWDSIVQNEYKVIYEKSQLALSKIIIELNNLIPTDDTVIINCLLKFKEQIEKSFIDCHFCDENLTTRYIYKFSEMMENEVNNILSMNRTACLEHNISLLNSLFPALFNDIENNFFGNDIDKLENEWSRVMEEFEMKAKGSSKIVAITEFSKRNSNSDIARMLNDVVVEMNSQILCLKNQEKMTKCNEKIIGEKTNGEIMTEIIWNRYKVQEFNRQVKEIQKSVLKKL